MSIWEISAYILAAIIAIIVLKIFSKPMKNVLWLCINSLLGGVGLFIFNTVLSPSGFTIAVNIVTASVCGLLGIPGLILLIILKLIFNI